MMRLHHVARLASISRMAYQTSVRKTSTAVGRSGRMYVRKDILQFHREDHRLSVSKAESENESFVYKRVSKPVYNHSMRHAADFAGSQRLRLHVDCNDKDCLLVYPYFQSTLLDLISEDSRLPKKLQLPIAERKKILRHVGEAIHEIHSKGWIQINIKPASILVNWTCDKEGNKTVTDVALGGFDIAYKPERGEPRQTPFPIGNVMWRSPEGQTGSAVTKASDIFSYGLVCIYTLKCEDWLILAPRNFQIFAETAQRPEQEVLFRHFIFFGSRLGGLLELVDSKNWRDLLKETSEDAEKLADTIGVKRNLEWWGRELGPIAQNMIFGMTTPDPAARPTIDQVLAHSWWQETA